MVGRAPHTRAVLASVVMNAMFRSGLLVSVSMDQVVWSYTFTCVESLWSW